MRHLTSTSIAALVVAMAASSGARAQAVNTSPSNVNVLNLLAPFLRLNGDATGQATLRQSLDAAVSLNNSASTDRRAEAISDKALPGSTPFLGTITLANGTVVPLGPADNLAGGEPLQRVQSNPGQPGTIAPNQPVGGYGVVLGAAYQRGIRNSTATSGPLANTFNLLNRAYNFTSADLGVAKNYFANGAATNPGTTPPNYRPVPAVAPPGYTLPTYNGLPNTTDSVLDLAYGVKSNQTGQDVYGDSRPVQVAPTRIQAFDPTALNGLATNPSFPSGHTNYAFTDSILLGMLTPSLYQDMMARAADYGASRIILGVHYPLDIIGSRAFAAYDLAQAFTNPLYLNNATTTSGTAINLPALFTAARAELSSYLTAQCGASVATCATAPANTANDPYAPSDATAALYRQRLTYGLPTLDFTTAPREAAPAGGPDASILLATVYGGSTAAAQFIAPTGGIAGQLQTGTINQVLVNTQNNALASFYGSALSYWTRIDLYAAAGYFGGLTGTLTMDPADRLFVPATVASGGTLYGNGASLNGNVTVQSGGTFGGGSATAAATTAVGGNLLLQSGSSYAVTATGTGVSRVTVAGTASVNGAGVVVTANDAALPFSQAQVLSAAGGINGTFAGVSGNGVAGSITIAGTTATLIINRTNVDYAGVGSTANERSISSGLNRGSATNTSATTGALLNGLFLTGQSSPALAQAALDRIGGEGLAATQNAALQSGHAFTSSVTDAMNAWRMGSSGGYAPVQPGVVIGALPGGALGYAATAPLAYPITKGPLVPLPPQRQWRVWGGGYGGENDIDGEAARGTARQTANFYGGLIGLDYQAQPNWLLGAAVGGSSADFNVPGRATSGNVTGAHGALFSSYGFAQGLYFDSSLAFSGYSNDTRRQAGGVGGLPSETERASFDSFEVRVRGEIGKRFFYGPTGVTPFAAVEYANLDADGFREQPVTGAGLLALRVAARTTESLPVFAGLRLDGFYSLSGGQVLRPFVQVAYVHEFDPTRNLNNGLLVLPNATFLVQGARPAKDGAQTKAGAEIALQPNVTLFATFDGEFSDRQTIYGGKGGLRVAF